MGLLSWLGSGPKFQALYVKDVGQAEVVFHFLDGSFHKKEFFGSGWWSSWGENDFPVYEEVEDVIDRWLKACAERGIFRLTKDFYAMPANIKCITVSPRDYYEFGVLEQ